MWQAFPCPHLARESRRALASCTSGLRREPGISGTGRGSHTLPLLQDPGLARGPAHGNRSGTASRPRPRPPARAGPRPHGGMDVKHTEQLGRGCCNHRSLLTVEAKSTRAGSCAEGGKGLLAPPFLCTAWFEGQLVWLQLGGLGRCWVRSRKG